jgi:hypothetical protein
MVDSVHHPWTAEGTGPRWTGPWPAEGGSLELGLAAAPGHGGSSAVVQQEEGCTGSPSRASPSHGRRRCNWATVVKKGW